MAYTHTRIRHLGLGLDLSQIISKGGPAVQAAAKVIEDPALPEVTCNVLRLNKITEGKPAGPPCARKQYTAAQKQRGIGLHATVMPLRVAAWARSNPALAAATGMAAIGGLMAIGYYFGRRSTR